MNRAQDIPQAIQWHEGMLLAPQHFQQHSLREAALLHYHTAVLGPLPFHWGVRYLQLDQALLASGTLRVSELEAVMPDGLAVFQNTGAPDDLQIDLTAYAERMKQHPVMVHLAIPAQRTDNASTQGERARYDSVEGRPTSDLNTGEGDLRIPRLKPRLSLLVPNENETLSGAFVHFPLIEVEYQNETYSATEYIPPHLQMPRPIQNLCLSVAQRVREKAQFLAEQITSALSASIDPHARLKIHHLVAVLPPFEALLHTYDEECDALVHPYLVYLSLCTLVGHVAALRDSVPPVLESYRHRQIRSTFEQATQFITQMLEEEVPETYFRVRFALKDGRFCVRFESAWLRRPTLIGVKGQPGIPEHEVAGWVEGCSIGSAPRIESVQHRRIPGATRRRIDQDSSIVAGRDVILFSLNIDEQFILGDEELQIFNVADRDSPPPIAEITLYVKNTL